MPQRGCASAGPSTARITSSRVCSCTAWPTASSPSAGCTTPTPRWSTARSREGELHEMELDAVDERVVVDRTRVCGDGAQRLAIVVARPLRLRVGDGAEGHHLHLVDLDGHAGDVVATADLGLRSRPEPERQVDPAGRDG